MKDYRLGSGTRKDAPFQTNTRYLYNEDMQGNQAIFSLMQAKSFPNTFPVFYFLIFLSVISNRPCIFTVFPFCTLHLRMLSLSPHINVIPFIGVQTKYDLSKGFSIPSTVFLFHAQEEPYTSVIYHKL